MAPYFSALPLTSAICNFLSDILSVRSSFVSKSGLKKMLLNHNGLWRRICFGTGTAHTSVLVASCCLLRVNNATFWTYSSRQDLIKQLMLQLVLCCHFVYRSFKRSVWGEECTFLRVSHQKTSALSRYAYII